MFMCDVACPAPSCGSLVAWQVRASDPNAKAMQKALAALDSAITVRVGCGM